VSCVVSCYVPSSHYKLGGCGKGLALRIFVLSCLVFSCLRSEGWPHCLHCRLSFVYCVNYAVVSPVHAVRFLFQSVLGEVKENKNKEALFSGIVCLA